MPKFSIITVTYNAANYLEETLKSVFKQTNKDFEYLIIDGASTDKTLDIINRNKENISLLVSEPDKGIYDAMNKGLKLAKGEFVWFLNAGDAIISENFIDKAINLLKKTNADVLYGEAIFIDKNRNEIGTRSQVTTHKLPENLNWKDFKYGMLVSHQAFIPKKAITDKFIENNLSADLEWEINCLKKSKKNIKYPDAIVFYLEGGLSKQKHLKSLTDRSKIIFREYGFSGGVMAHIKIFFRSVYKIVKNRGKYWIL